MTHPYAHYYLAKARIDELRRTTENRAAVRPRRSSRRSARSGPSDVVPSGPATDVSRLPKLV